jgi:hypothetical protein
MSQAVAMVPDPVGVLSRAGAELGSLAGEDWWPLPDGPVRDGLAAVRAVSARAEGVLVVAVREALGRDLPGRDGAASAVAWLRALTPMTVAEAARVVRLATALRSGFADTAAALREGRVGAESASVVVRAIEQLPTGVPGEVVVAAERHLLAQAERFDARELAALGKRVLQIVDPDAADRQLARRLAAEERAAERTTAFHLTPDPDGTGGCIGWLRLGAADTGLLEAALEPLMNPLLGATLTAGDGDVDESGRDTRSTARRRADALLELCRRALAGDQLPEHGGRRPQVIVTVDADRLRARVGAGQVATGQEVSIDTVRRIACDAGILPAVLAGDGRPLDVGRSRRLITGTLRTALVLRDRGCVFPGCDRPPAWCDGHHLRHWVDGGNTSLDNSALLCGHHHRLIHTDTWEIRLNPASRRPEVRRTYGIDAPWRQNRVLRT